MNSWLEAAPDLDWGLAGGNPGGRVALFYPRRAEEYGGDSKYLAGQGIINPIRVSRMGSQGRGAAEKLTEWCVSPL